MSVAGRTGTLWRHPLLGPVYAAFVAFALAGLAIFVVGREEGRVQVVASGLESIPADLSTLTVTISSPNGKQQLESGTTTGGVYSSRTPLAGTHVCVTVPDAWQPVARWDVTMQPGLATACKQPESGLILILLLREQSGR